MYKTVRSLAHLSLYIPVCKENQTQLEELFRTPCAHLQINLYSRINSQKAPNTCQNNHGNDAVKPSQRDFVNVSQGYFITANQKLI